MDYRHDYEDVRQRAVWNTVQKYLPPLLAMVEQELRVLGELPLSPRLLTRHCRVRNPQHWQLTLNPGEKSEDLDTPIAEW